MKKSKNDIDFKQIKEVLQTSPAVLWLLLVILTVLFTTTHYPKQTNHTYLYSTGDIAQNREVGIAFTQHEFLHFTRRRIGEYDAGHAFRRVGLDFVR